MDTTAFKSIAPRFTQLKVDRGEMIIKGPSKLVSLISSPIVFIETKDALKH